jgi:preprotein translocase subunit SecG
MPLLLKIAIVMAAAFAVLSLFVGPRRAWGLWREFGHVLGNAIARVAMTIFFFTVLIPFALIGGRRADALDLRRREPPFWRRLEPTDESLEKARKQY